MAEAPQPELERGGQDWSIVDGFYDPESFIMDRTRLDQSEEVTKGLPEIATLRYLATEVVTYAFELANPAAVENDFELARKAHADIARVAQENANEAITTIDATAQKAKTGPVMGAPIVQILNRIFLERWSDDPILQANCLAIVVKLARRGPSRKFLG